MPIDPDTAKAMTPAEFAAKYGRPVEMPPSLALEAARRELEDEPPAPIVTRRYHVTMPNGQEHDLSEAQAERLAGELRDALQPVLGFDRLMRDVLAADVAPSP